MALGEIFAFAYETFSSNKVKFALTALGMVIGTASLILVTTIGLTGKQYVLNLIQSIGANEIYAEYEGGAPRITNVTADPLTIDDMKAVMVQVPGIAAASPVVPLDERVPVGNGQERDIRVLGVYPDYYKVRNLVTVSGRFFDDQDAQAHNKVGVVTQEMATQFFGSTQQAVGKVHETQRTSLHDHRHIQGTRGHVWPDGSHRQHHADSVFGRPVLPGNAGRETDLFFDGGRIGRGPGDSADSQGDSVAAPSRVGIQRAEPDATGGGRGKTANALTLVLLSVSLVVLLVSGIGIMNIMLSTVSSRIREIGIRKAIRATTREIRFQFLSEAILISLVGGFWARLSAWRCPSPCVSLPTTGCRFQDCRRLLRCTCRRWSASSSERSRRRARRNWIRWRA